MRKTKLKRGNSVLKRTPLKRGKSVLRRTPLRKRGKSSYSKLIKECDKLFFEVLIKERGRKCEICGSFKQIGTFHILDKKNYSRLRYKQINALLACWWGCHHVYHHSYYEARDRIIPKIKELRGEDYEDQLKALNAISEPLNTFQLNLLKVAFQRELDVIH